MSKSKSTKKAKKSTKAENAAIAARMAANAKAKPSRKKLLPGESNTLASIVAQLTPAERPSKFLDDPRLPAVGTTIERVYKDKTYRVERNAADFTYEGRSYRSLSAIASEILGGASVNGFLWFGLTPRASAKAKPAKAKPASAAPKDPSANDIATAEGQRRALHDLLTPKRRKGSKSTRKVDTTTADAPAGDDIAQDAPAAE